jgi:hypothetical protein
MAQRCSWATAHWLRFRSVETPDRLDLTRPPRGASSWKIGPDGPPAPDGSRLPSEVWGGVGLYCERRDAEAALDDPSAFLPFLDRLAEAWHVLLQPTAHRGECNHLDPNAAGLLFEVDGADPGGPLVVMTTVGFDLGPAFDLDRVIAFRRGVDRVREVFAHSDGILAHRVFAPHVRGEDGVTMTLWRDEHAMFAFAYRPGLHRTEINRYKAEQTADRTSFTRFRALRTSGSWAGGDPLMGARADVGA